MKKTVCILFIFVIILSLCSCNSNTNTMNIDTVRTNIGKDGVGEFSNLLIGSASTNIEYDDKHCYNVTPAEVLEETDMRIFKSSDTCASFLMIDNQIYTLCESLGGYGFVDALPCDFDNDGNKDLLVASSWGSGVHRSEISVFRYGNISPTIIYDTTKGDTLYTDLALKKSPLSFFTGNENDTELVYGVWGVYVKAENANLADLTLEYEEPIGYVKSESNRAVFVLADTHK